MESGEGKINEVCEALIFLRYLNLKSQISRLAINKDFTLLAVGGTSIDIVDIKTWRIVRTFAGHASSITDLKWSKDDQLFSCAQEDRFLSCWNLNELEHSGLSVN